MAGLEGTKTDRQALTGDISVKHGLDWESVTIVKITESTEDGGTNIVEFSDGSTLKIKNGSGGKIGIDGKSAYQYAQDGGYTGTEDEFALLMSQENLQTEKVDKISNEVSKLSEDIATKASVIKEKASGEVIVVTDSAEAKPLGLAIDGKSEQNGTPTPDNPIEIVNVGKYDEASGKYAVEVKGTGKNLLDCRGFNETVNNGITYTPVYDKNGLLKYIEVNGTASATSTFEIIKTFKSGKYILNGCPSGGEVSTYTLQCKLDNAGGTALGEDNGKGLSFTLNEERLIDIYIRIGSGTTCVNLRFYPMLCYAEITDGTYEPYKETTATVYLDEPLRKGDVVCWNSQKMWVERNRATYALNGTETYIHQSTWTNESLFIITSELPNWNPRPVNNNQPTIICNSLIATSTTQLANNKENGIAQGGSEGKLIYISVLGKTTPKDIKAYLAEKPLEFEYELAEPITEEIDLSLGELSMFYPTTILSNDCNANMEVTYIADTKAYIDKKFAELATAMV